jgi:hypothetical protein
MKTISVTENELAVINYLRDGANRGRFWYSPTTIGIDIGHKKYNGASSWASRICKKLVVKKILLRNSKGHYGINPKIFNRAIYLNIPKTRLQQLEEENEFLKNRIIEIENILKMIKERKMNVKNNS